MRKTKKWLALLIAALTALAIAVPAFADWTVTPYMVMGTTNNYLSVSRPNSSYNMKGRALTLYQTNNPGFDQHFTVVYSNYGGKRCVYFERVENGVVYAINRANSTTKKAIMWTLSDGMYDSAFKPPYPDSHGLFNLLNYSESLTRASNSPGTTITFSSQGSGWEAAGTPTL